MIIPIEGSDTKISIDVSNFCYDVTENKVYGLGIRLKGKGRKFLLCLFVCEIKIKDVVYWIVTKDSMVENGNFVAIPFECIDIWDDYCNYRGIKLEATEEFVWR